jgi:hypothetical protein
MKRGDQGSGLELSYRDYARARFDSAEKPPYFEGVEEVVLVQEQLARLSKQLRFGVVLERTMTFGCGCQRLWSAEGGVCRPRGFTLPSLRQDMLP